MYCRKGRGRESRGKKGKGGAINEGRGSLGKGGEEGREKACSVLREKRKRGGGRGEKARDGKGEGKRGRRGSNI